MPSPPRPATRLPPDDRRTQLVEFGRRHFADNAFDAASMQEIARLAGVSKGLLYHYFGSRRGFYLATIRQVIDGALEAMHAAALARPGDRLGALVQGFVGYCAQNAGIYKALTRGGLGADAEVAHELGRVRRFALGQLLAAAGIEEPSPLAHIALVGWIAFVEAAVAEWLEAPPVPEATLVSLVIDTLTPAIDRLSRLEET